MVLYPAVSLVSINPEGSHNHPARDAPALAQGRLSLLLALEVAPTGRISHRRSSSSGCTQTWGVISREFRLRLNMKEAANWGGLTCRRSGTASVPIPRS